VVEGGEEITKDEVSLRRESLNGAEGKVLRNFSTTLADLL